MVPTLTSNDELLLPNGKALGHRKYRRFYKQSIHLNSWFNNSMKKLGVSENSQALICKHKLIEIMKQEHHIKKFERKG